MPLSNLKETSKIVSEENFYKFKRTMERYKGITKMAQEKKVEI